MARIKREGKGRKGKGRKRYYKNAQKCYISHPCSECPNDAIFTKFVIVVDLTCVMTYANFGWYRLKGGHFALYKIYLFPHDFTGWPYNRQALTCCRDRKIDNLFAVLNDINTNIKQNTLKLMAGAGCKKD